MTETEWAASADPGAMVLALPTRAYSARKSRLFVCSCCRRFWAVAPPCVRALVELAERYSDKRYTRERFDKGEVAGALAALRNARPTSTGPEVCAIEAAEHLFRRHRDQRTAAAWAVRAATNDRRGLFAGRDRRREQAVQAQLVRDIFGNPFRPVAFDPRWRIADVTALARGIYEDRAFDRLPLLADALMDAGCDDEQVLSHCRGDGPHVRGCWVVDLVLGKE